MEMTVLKNFELIKVTDNPYKIKYIGKPMCAFHADDPKDAQFEIKEEMINGRLFKRPNGETFCFGISKEIEEILGLCFDHQDWLIEDNERLRFDYNNLFGTINKIYNMTFWQKLKFLFKCS